MISFLQRRRQVAEVVAVAGHAHDQVAVLLRLRLRLTQCLGRHHVELNVVPVQLEVRPDQVRQVVDALLAFHTPAA